VETIEPHIGDDHQYPNRTIDKITFQNWINFAGLYNANYGVRFRNRKTRTCAGAIGSNAYWAAQTCGHRFRIGQRHIWIETLVINVAKLWAARR